MIELLVSFCICMLLSALFSGAETGFYSLSSTRLAVDAENGRRMARLVHRLVRGEHALLVAILVGNNLMIELVTHYGDGLFGRLGLLPADAGRELVLTALLTPIVFFFAELAPKDLFRRRPHTLLGFAAPVVALARIVFLPVTYPLGLVARLVERVVGIDDSGVEELRNREHVYEMLEEGTLSGALAADAVELARNVLEVRGLSIATVMVPWKDVATLDAELPEDQLLERIATSDHTRLPIVRADGSVDGYIHQLDALADELPGRLDRHRRDLLELTPDVAVDRALSRLRRRGQRAALVRAEGAVAPLGLVTLKDLAQTIVGDLADW